MAHEADEPAHAVRLKGPEESPIASLAHRPSMAGIPSRSMASRSAAPRNTRAPASPSDLLLYDSAYVLIAMLSVAMGLRNTIARRIGDPNLATTVLNLTLSACVSHTPTGIASEGELALRGAAIAAILTGAVTGALLLKVSLALAIAAAAAVVVGAAISSRGSRSEAPPP
jgi:hypothetical protein